MDPQTVRAVHYLPIATTILSVVFLVVLIRAIRIRRSGPHLAWWAFGILTYGIGTALESSITLFGNTPELNKAWYIAGALFGGYPLAQGSVYLLFDRKFANRLTAWSLPFVCLAAVFVLMSPADASLIDIHRPSGASLSWHWVRLLTPFVNLYSAVFLIGGAIASAVRYAKERSAPQRVWGNATIAFGALLPGIGGSMAKAGLVEALYIGECVGLILMWVGYAIIASKKRSTAVSNLTGATGQR